MEPAIVTALSAVLGSLVGGAATIATAWFTQRSLGRRELRHAEIERREQLYGEFVAELSRLAIDAYAHGLERPETLFPAYALLSRVRLVASPAVLSAAERAVRRVTDQYFAPNLSLPELRELARTGQQDPLREFGQASRAELAALRGEQ